MVSVNAAFLIPCGVMHQPLENLDTSVDQYISCNQSMILQNHTLVKKKKNIKMLDEPTDFNVNEYKGFIDNGLRFHIAKKNTNNHLEGLSKYFYLFQLRICVELDFLFNILQSKQCIATD